MNLLAVNSTENCRPILLHDYTVGCSKKEMESDYIHTIYFHNWPNICLLIHSPPMVEASN